MVDIDELMWYLLSVEVERRLRTLLLIFCEVFGGFEPSGEDALGTTGTLLVKSSLERGDSLFANPLLLQSTF